MLPPDYEIRAPRPEEISDLPGIEVAAAQVVPVEDLPVHLRDDSSPPEEFGIAADEGRLLVAVHRPSAAVVGFALMLVVDGNGHLHELDVHPDHAQRGIGAALVEAVATWAIARKFEAVTLTTFRHLKWNAPFYERHGFLEFPDVRLGPELAEMRKEEAESGLDNAKRLAMRRDVSAG